MFTVGLDVHQRQSTMCVLNQDGRIVNERKVEGSFVAVAEALRGIEAPIQVCYEASCGAGKLHDLLAGVAGRVVVAHPGQVRLIFRSKKKNDRVDARKLAKLLYLDEVPPVYVPGVDVRAWRGLIEHRRRLIDKRTRTKNSLRAIVRSHGVLPPRRPGLWTAKGRAWLAGLPLPTETESLKRDMLLEELVYFDGAVARVDAALNRIAAGQPGVALLRTIPGIGARTAEAVAAYIDRPERFGRIKAIGAYFGIVPSQDASGPVNRLGHITREGPATVRKLVVEAAWHSIRCSTRVRGYFERIHGGDRERRKIALVATAHYLLRVMLAMLKSGEAWRPEDQTA
jgi:transposase